MSFRSTISTQKLERNRASKMPTQAQTEQASKEFPGEPMKAAMRALDLASRWPRSLEVFKKNTA